MLLIVALHHCVAFLSNINTFNRSDGRVVCYRASASGSVDLKFDSESGQTNDLKIGIHSFPA